MTNILSFGLETMAPSKTRVRGRQSRADRAIAAVLRAEARDAAHLVGFAATQAEVAGRIVELTARWSDRIHDNAVASFPEPLLPELWEALRTERVLVTGMCDFRFWGSSASRDLAWPSAVQAELGLNYALFGLHLGLSRDPAKALSPLENVGIAAHAAMNEAERLAGALLPIAATSLSGRAAEATGMAARSAQAPDHDGPAHRVLAS